MTLREHLRTIDLARAGGISVQQIRNYESCGLLPPCARSKSAYRLYTPQHLAALKTGKSLVSGYGWQRAVAMMRAIHQGEFSTALALVDQRHAELASTRLHVEQTLAALRVLAEQAPTLTYARHPQRLRVSEAAQQVGVRVSALHFWEQQGLLHPIREQSSRYRLYDEQQMRRLRVVVLLRETHYGFDAIRLVLDELAANRPEKAIAAVEKRLSDLTRMSWTCVEALGLLRVYVHEYYADFLA